jgi:hypothetical protein
VFARIISIVNEVVRRLLKNQVTINDLLISFRHDFKFLNGASLKSGVDSLFINYFITNINEVTKNYE